MIRTILYTFGAMASPPALSGVAALAQLVAPGPSDDEAQQSYLRMHDQLTELEERKVRNDRPFTSEMGIARWGWNFRCPIRNDSPWDRMLMGTTSKEERDDIKAWERWMRISSARKHVDHTTGG